MSVLSSGKDALGRKSLRKGQRDILTHLRSYRDATIINCFFPTGYGKSLSALVAFAELRAQGRVDRVLFVVPNLTQLDQYARGLEKLAKEWGIPLTGVSILDGSVRNLREHRTNVAEIFVTTVQSISAKKRSGNGFIVDLTSTGRWMLVADEHHHYADGADWGQALLAVRVAFTMAMSATPYRLLGRSIFGEPTSGLSISFPEALKEGAVKRFKIRAYNFFVDIQDEESGEVTRITTDDIRREHNLPDNFIAWEARRKIRYLTKYVTPLLAQAVGDLMERRERTGKPIQMLVYAMSCRHAEHLYEQLRDITNLRIGWAGTGPNGRTDPENREVISAFLDSNLDVLVQVGMAGEGFDSVWVGVICDLEIGGLTPQKIQKYGRGARIMPGVDNKHNYCRIYLPTDSYLSDKTTRDIHDIFATEFESSDEDTDGNKPDDNNKKTPVDWWDEPIDRAWEPIDVELDEVRELSEDGEEFKRWTESLNRSRAPGEPARDFRDPINREHAKRAWKECYFERATEQASSDRIQQWKDKIDRDVGKLAWAVAIRKGGRDPANIGKAKNAINEYIKKKFGARGSLLETELRNVHEWICDVHELARVGKWAPPCFK